MTRRVLLTGATGFIGSHVLPHLVNAGYDVHAVCRYKETVFNEDVEYHRCDLLSQDDVESVVWEIDPTHVLHLAWCIDQVDYGTTRNNVAWVTATNNLFRAFDASIAAPVGRMVVAGTCFEYAPVSGVYDEFLIERNPTTLYGNCKDITHSLMNSYDFSSAWARIFYLYGPNEMPNRLVPAVINKLLVGEVFECNNPNLIRDYLYVDDVAAALVAILDSNIKGPVNVGNGSPITIANLINVIVNKIGGDVVYKETKSNEANMIVAKNNRLKSLGWEPRYDLGSGLDATIEYWRKYINKE